MVRIKLIYLVINFTTVSKSIIPLQNVVKSIIPHQILFDQRNSSNAIYPIHIDEIITFRKHEEDVSTNTINIISFIRIDLSFRKTFTIAFDFGLRYNNLKQSVDNGINQCRSIGKEKEHLPGSKVEPSGSFFRIKKVRILDPY